MRTLDISTLDYTSDDYEQFMQQLYQLINPDKAAWDIPNGISVCEAGNAQNPGVIGFTAFIDTDADETHTLLKKYGKLLKSKGDNR